MLHCAQHDNLFLTFIFVIFVPFVAKLKDEYEHALLCRKKGAG
jgi:hypothetical protein